MGRRAGGTWAVGFTIGGADRLGDLDAGGPERKICRGLGRRKPPGPRTLPCLYDRLTLASCWLGQKCCLKFRCKGDRDFAMMLRRAGGTSGCWEMNRLWSSGGIVTPGILA